MSKLLFLISIILLTAVSYGQNLTNTINTVRIPDGIYKSSENSFRQNYYLNVLGDSVTLFGWETSLEKDTIYFKSGSVLLKEEHDMYQQDSLRLNITFNKFEFSSNPVKDDNLDGFIANSKVDIPVFSLHRYFLEGKIIDGSLYFTATKDRYDSRSDDFHFKRIK